MMPLDATRLPDPDRHADFYAAVPVKRAVAFAIDCGIVALLTTLVVLLTAFTALFFLPVAFGAVNFVYRWIALARASATPGMRLVSILFLDRSGSRLDAASAFLHTLGTTLSFAFVLPQIGSAVLMLTSPRGQGLTDLVLGTVAINRAAEV